MSKHCPAKCTVCSVRPACIYDYHRASNNQSTNVKSPDDVTYNINNIRRWAILCFVDCASRYSRVIKTNLMHYLSSVYFVSQPLHVSDIFVAHHQEVYCIYTTIGTCWAF